MKIHGNMLKMTLAAMFLGLAFALPFLTGQIPAIGSMLCPMHIPALLCGFICGWPWGLAVGFLAPLLRSLALGMPPLFPTAVCMALELAAYGAVSGWMHQLLPRKRRYLYCALLVAMIAGRAAWGAAMFVCMGISGGSFTFAAFLTGAFVKTIPGMIVQIALIPIIVGALDHSNIVQVHDGMERLF